MERIFAILEGLRPEVDFHGSDDFIGDGMLDSFDIVSLVSELEDTFGILIDALDITPENFSSSYTIAEVVKKNGGQI